MALQTVLKNICSFVEVLSSSRNASVASWNSQSLCNAFEWAAYCEQIYTQSKGKPYYQDLDGEIRKIGELLWVQENSSVQVNLELLQHSSKLLVRNLLQNVNLKPDLLMMLSPGVIPDSAVGFFLQECCHLVHFKATCRLLSAVQNLSTQCTFTQPNQDQRLMNPGSLSAVELADDKEDPKLLCLAKLLLRYMSIHFKNADNEADSVSARLKSVLLKEFSQTYFGQRVLATSFVVLTSSEKHPLTSASSKAVLEECLRSIIQLDKRLVVKLSPSILTRICNCSFQFYRDYIQCLVNCCDNMKPVYGTNTEFDKGDRLKLISWKSSSSSDHSQTPAVSYDQVKSCFSHLLCYGLPSVVSATRQVLCCFAKRCDSSVWVNLLGDLDLQFN